MQFRIASLDNASAMTYCWGRGQKCPCENSKERMAMEGWRPDELPVDGSSQAATRLWEEYNPTGR
jgi:hypothetical protein